MNGWTFLTNHAHVLLCIERDQDVRLRDLADLVGITERAAQRIVNELIDAGYVSRERVGRRNHYVVHPNLPLRHSLECHRDVGALLTLLAAPSKTTRTPTSTRYPLTEPARMPETK